MFHVQMDDDIGNHNMWAYVRKGLAIKRFKEQVEALKKRDVRGRIILGEGTRTKNETIEEFWHKDA